MREDWKEIRIKDFCSYVSRGIAPNYVDNSDYFVVNQATFSRGFFDLDNIRYTDNNNPNALLRDNDLLMASTGGGVLGKVYFYQKFDDKEYYADTHVTILRSVKESTKFLYYIFSTKYDYINSILAKGSTNQTELQRDKLLNYAFNRPPLPKQHALVNYLDEKLAVIDRHILLLEKKRKRYTALRKSLINKTVRYGLNPDVELKDSGIEWLGKIPKHWEVKRMKDIGYIYSGLSGKSGEDFNNDETEYNRPFIPYTNILNNLYIDVNQTKGVVIYENENQNRVKKDDLFFLMSSEDYESLGLSSILIEEAPELYLNSFCKGFRFTCQNIYPKFVNFQLRSDLFRDAMRLEGRGFTRINLKIDKITSQFVSLPPLSEQQTIACYLDAQSEKIDRIVANINMQLDKLTNLKKSLINECVTGERIIQI
jgi:type I restriction enzyme S subunit